RLARFAHPLQAAKLSLGLLADLVRHPRLVDLTAIVIDYGALVLAQLLADRLELLAQEVVALLLLGPGLDVVADPPADLKLRQALALCRDRLLETLGDIQGLEQLALLLEAQVGRVAGGVRQGARLDDRAQERADSRIRFAQLEDLLDHSAVLARELSGALGA